MPDAPTVTVYLHADDAAMVDTATLLDGDAVSVCADARLERGQIRLEAGCARAEAGLDERLRQIIEDVFRRGPVSVSAVSE